MNYALRWCGHDGNAKETPGGTDLECAVDLARVLANHYDGVEVLDETERVVWPVDPADADL